MRLSMGNLFEHWAKEHNSTVRNLASIMGAEYTGMFKLIRGDYRSCNLTMLYKFANATGTSIALIPNEQLGLLNEKIVVLDPNGNGEPNTAE